MKKKDDNDTSHYEGAILENLQDKVDVILEILKTLKPMAIDIRGLKTDVHQLKDDVYIIKKVVTGQSAETQNHERRIAKLEEAI